MEHNSFFPGLAAVLRSVCGWCSAFWLFTANRSGGIEGVRLFPFLLGSAAVYVLIRLYLRRERSMLSLVVLCAVLGTLLAAVLWICFTTFTQAGAWFFVILAVGATVYSAARACVEMPSAAGSLTAMELTTLYFLVFLWIQSALGLETVYSLPLLSAVLVSLVEVCYLRLSGAQHNRKSGLFVVAAVLAVFFALMGLFLTYGADSLADALVALTHAAIAFWNWLTGLLYRVLLWLFSLLPEVEVDASVSYAPPEQLKILETAEPSTASVALIVAAGAGLGIYALFLLLRHLGAVRIGGKKAAVVGKVERQRFAFFHWLAGMMQAVKDRAVLEWRLLRRRSSPQALYIFLLRSGRSLQVKKGRGESPPAFIRRMAALTEGEEPLRHALAELAVALERALYAPSFEGTFPAENARLIRRSFRRALRRARFAAALVRWS